MNTNGGISVNINEFLLARIAEDEAAARAVSGPLTQHTDIDGTVTISHDADVLIRLTRAQQVEMASASAKTLELWGRYGPARVLAECEAKRRIVELHRRVGLSPIYQCNSCGVASQNLGQRFPCRTLRALAAVYADHPDYDPAWSPA